MEAGIGLQSFLKVYDEKDNLMGQVDLSTLRYSVSPTASVIIENVNIPITRRGILTKVLLGLGGITKNIPLHSIGLSPYMMLEQGSNIHFPKVILGSDVSGFSDEKPLPSMDDRNRDLVYLAHGFFILGNAIRNISSFVGYSDIEAETLRKASEVCTRVMTEGK